MRLKIVFVVTVDHHYLPGALTIHPPAAMKASMLDRITSSQVTTFPLAAGIGSQSHTLTE
jgi:hypothetical protein